MMVKLSQVVLSGIVDNFEHQDFEQDVVNEYSLIQGKLRACISFWEDTVEASDFVLDIIEHGCKIRFSFIKHLYVTLSKMNLLLYLGA